MRFNKLDLNLLVALDALLAECSITRAAERLHMSASAMSSALARLRCWCRWAARWRSRRAPRCCAMRCATC